MSEIKAKFILIAGHIICRANIRKIVKSIFYSERKYKQLSSYIVRMPVANTCYFAIEKRIETNNSWYFEENEELSRSCFGLTYRELEYLVRVYAETFGKYNSYVQYPRITRSMNKDNFCDITGIWIPPKFPYITFASSEYSFSHVSLYGFYRHIGLLLSIDSAIVTSKIFDSEIIKIIMQINDYFTFGIKVTKEYVYPELFME